MTMFRINTYVTLDNHMATDNNDSLNGTENGDKSLSENGWSDILQKADIVLAGKMAELITEAQEEMDNTIQEFKSQVDDTLENSADEALNNMENIMDELKKEMREAVFGRGK